MEEIQGIVLGATYRDQISGFTGVATGHAFYISGCSQVLLAPPTGENGAHRSSEWFDEQRLVHTDAAVIVLDNSRTPGPDKEAPKH